MGRLMRAAGVVEQTRNQCRFIYIQQERMLVKVCYGDSTHVIKLSEESDYQNIVKSLHSYFTHLPSTLYLAESQDGSDVFTQEKLDQYRSQNATKIKLFIRNQRQSNVGVQSEIQPCRPENIEAQNLDELTLVEEKVEEQATLSRSDRNGVSDGTSEENKGELPQHDCICEICRVCPIIGIKYKCITCEQFNLCSKCEQQNEHGHALLKIRYPKQQPVKLQCIESKKQQQQSESWHQKAIKVLKKESIRVIDKAKDLNQRVIERLSNNSEKKEEKDERQDKTDKTFRTASYISEALGLELAAGYRIANNFDDGSLTDEQILDRYLEKGELTG